MACYLSDACLKCRHYSPKLSGEPYERDANCLFILIGLLSACASIKPAPSSSISSATQDVHQLTAWQIHGSVSIVQPQHSTIATLNWQQSGRDQYYLLLYGPLSLGQVEIKGQPGQVTLTQSGHQPLTATNAETLIQQQLGWQFPVDHLYDWVRGIPATGAAATQQQFDANHRLIQFTQNGWHIQYLEFMSAQGYALPRRMVLVNGGLRITLAIKRWS
ncbi:MAG: lipoprotein insertase outer membrane protein LolB [Gammaproteobacteria bacterium]